MLGRGRGRRRQSGVLQDNPFGRNKSFRFLRCFQFVPNFVVGKDRIVPNQVRHAKEPPSTKCLASSDSNGIRIGGLIVTRRQANDTFLAEPATMLLRHAGDLEDQFCGICAFVHRRCAFAEGTAWRGAGSVANVVVLPVPMLPVANAGQRRRDGAVFYHGAGKMTREKRRNRGWRDILAGDGRTTGQQVAHRSPLAKRCRAKRANDECRPRRSRAAAFSRSAGPARGARCRCRSCRSCRRRPLRRPPGWR